MITPQTDTKIFVPSPPPQLLCSSYTSHFLGCCLSVLILCLIYIFYLYKCLKRLQSLCLCLGCKIVAKNFRKARSAAKRQGSRHDLGQPLGGSGGMLPREMFSYLGLLNWPENASKSSMHYETYQFILATKDRNQKLKLPWRKSLV